MSRRGRRLPVALAIVGALGVVVGGTAMPAAAAGAPVSGAGSTFAAIAIDQWRRDVNRTQGLQVTYTASGSSQGRRQFIADTVDWASSDIPFEVTELPVPREFTYLPLVAGGTALMYNVVDSAGRQITNLQLSGPTVARIFTGKIRNWSADEIKADNPGLASRLPNQDIKAVVRSGGSGTSAVFTGYFAKLAPDIWREFASQYGIPDQFTSTFPDVPGFIKQSGSDGIANFVANPNAGKGSIGYAEAGYAKQRGLPVAYVRNQSGSWTQPTARAVAVALLKAQRNADGTQNLDGVYFSEHPEAYAISSYNYAIVPTAGLDPAKGESLGAFMIYCITEGQAKAAQLGYSPLPPNLVQQGLDVVRQIPGAPTPPPLGDWGKFYEGLQVNAPPKQPPPPQTATTTTKPNAGQTGTGSATTIRGGSAAASGSGAGSVTGDGAATAATELGAVDPGADGGVSAAEPGAAGPDGVSAGDLGDGSGSSSSGATGDPLGGAGVFAAQSEAPILPATDAGGSLLLLAGLFVTGLVFLPPLVGTGRRRPRGAGGASSRGDAAPAPVVRT